MAEQLASALARFNSAARAKRSASQHSTYANSSNSNSTSATIAGVPMSSEQAAEIDSQLRASFAPAPLYAPRAPYPPNPRYTASLTDDEAVSTALTLASNALAYAGELASPYPEDGPEDPETADPAMCSAFVVPSSPEELAAAVASVTSKNNSNTNNDSSKATADSTATATNGGLHIPRIFPRPTDPSQLRLKLEKECRTRYLESLAHLLLSDQEVLTLWQQLLSHETAPKWDKIAEDAAADTAKKIAWAATTGDDTHGHLNGGGGLGLFNSGGAGAGGATPTVLRARDVASFHELWGPSQDTTTTVNATTTNNNSANNNNSSSSGSSSSSNNANANKRKSIGKNERDIENDAYDNDDFDPYAVDLGYFYNNNNNNNKNRGQNDNGDGELADVNLDDTNPLNTTVNNSSNNNSGNDNGSGVTSTQRLLTVSERVALAGSGGIYSTRDALGARMRAATRVSQSLAASALGKGGLTSSLLPTVAASEDLEAGERLDFFSYTAAARACAESGAPGVAALLSPTLFARFPRDSLGRISARALHQYVTERAAATRARISLSCFDEEGLGTLREQDLETYVQEQISSMPPLADVDEMFAVYYTYTVVRKFMFFFDPMRKGRVSIAKMVISPVFKHFNKLRQGSYMPTPRMDPSLHMNSSLSWYSAAMARAVYDQYITLDANRNGMLSRDEMYHYNGGNVSPLVIDRLFDEVRLYASVEDPAELEMDYKTFLDFVIALEHRATPQSIRFFFSLLDVHNRGYLIEDDVRLLVSALHPKLPPDVADAALVDAVVLELFDLAEPRDPGRITLQDMQRCGAGGHIIGVLSDATLWTAYDQREWMPSPKRLTH